MGCGASSRRVEEEDDEIDVQAPSSLVQNLDSPMPPTVPTVISKEADETKAAAVKAEAEALLCKDTHAASEAANEQEMVPSSFVQDLDSTVPPLLREDVEHAAAQAAKPLPEGSEWHSKGGKELEEHLAYTTLIDAAWLLKLLLGEVMPEREGVIPAWQDVPPEAVVKLEDLRHTTMSLNLPIAVLSYGWAARHQYMASLRPEPEPCVCCSAL